MTLHPDLGTWFLTLALIAAAVQAFAGVRETDVTLARRAAFVSAAAVAAAFVVLISAFLASDFSVSNVAANSHINKPVLYKVAAAWGNHEGSMVLWCLVLTGFAAAFARSRALSDAMSGKALTVFAALSSAFLLFTVLASSPFERLSPAPWEGRGFNPLLQDPAVALHPPALYGGFVGLAAPFAIAVAALWAGSVEPGWARVMRRWSLFAFAMLSVGVGLGSYWAYYELGWGGWWFWDPVENASLMPWLLAAALFHTALVSERRKLFFGWAALLAVLAFSFSILGTFLTRSGLITSVHAFAVDPSRGVVLLVILCGVLGLPLTVFALRNGRLATPDAPPVMASREGLLVANNLFLVTTTAVVLLGTLWPLIAELATGRPVSVGPPFYNQAALPIIAAAFVLTPLATLIPWGGGGTSLAAIIRTPKLAIAAGAAALGAVTVGVLSAGAHFGPAIAAALGVWLIAGAVLDLRQKFKTASDGAASLGLITRRPGMIAAALAHGGLGLLALGAGVDAAFSTERVVVLEAGQSEMTDAGAVRLAGVETQPGPNFDALIGDVRLVDPSGRERQFAPSRRYYGVRDQSTTEVDIQSSPRGDTYVALGPPARADGRSPQWTVRVRENVLIWMVFVGASLIALGAFAAVIGAARPLSRGAS